ncbi:HEAT repeat domain-containing protein [Haloferula chungangensis]|uniref:HEAT repeat domain-containing protein n=1 Tax=Haloferula chungangensis TaxID=1048331 RepID=A0ABW2LBV0_9BACT
MKFHHLFLGASLIAQLQALDSGQLAAVSQKFAQESGDAQYEARMELNKLVDEATAPGNKDTAEVNKLLIETLNAEQTPAEAKKYILRVLCRTAGADDVAALNTILIGSDPLLREEARRAIESIHSDASVAALMNALSGEFSTEDNIGLINSLAAQGSTDSVKALKHFIFDEQSEVARAAINALGRIGGSSAITTLKEAHGSNKLSPAIKQDLECAMLLVDNADHGPASFVYNTTASEALRVAAFLSLTSGDLTPEKSALLEDGLKNANDDIRQASLQQGLRAGLPSLQERLTKDVAQFSPADRLVILANLQFLKSSEAAEAIAKSLLDSEDEAERIAALTALGHLSTKSAFTAVLQALAARQPRVNQAAGSVISDMDFPAGDAILTSMLESGSSEDKVLAIKALNYRRLENSSNLLLGIMSGSDKAAAQEAMKSLNASADLEDLAKLCEAARNTSDADRRKRIVSICQRIAKRLDSDEARKLIEGL